MVYIGETSVSLKQKHYQHMSASKNPQRWTLCEWAISYYGEPTLETIETIEVADNEEKTLKDLLKEAKEKWIKFYDSDVENGKGFNNKHKISWVDFLLNEKYNEICAKEGWDEKLEYLDGVLNSIRTKICITKEKLNKEEKRIWYRYKFKEYDYYGDECRETTFSSFYKRRYLDEDYDWGDVPYKTLEISDVSEEKKQAEIDVDPCFFDDTISDAFNNHLCKDIEQRVWEKVKKQNPVLIQIKENLEEKEQERRDKIRFKADLRSLKRILKE